MTKELPVYPFDPQRCVGSLCEVGPGVAKANLPSAASAEGQWLYGHRLGGGQVGDFIVIECGDVAVFGRLINVKLPERERLSVEPELGMNREAHPIGTIQLLTQLPESSPLYVEAWDPTEEDLDAINEGLQRRAL